jgi:glycosyltransferase 2 family protein
MRRRVYRWARLMGGAAILAVLIGRLGTGPFVHGLHMITGWSLVAAAGIAALTTVCSAWRWSLVARGLGVGIPLHSAVSAYYRSQFLNTVLPGGVLGDVNRAVRHGRDAGDIGRGLRAVAWERLAGQVVQVALTMIVLVIAPSPVRLSRPIVMVAAAAVVVGALGAVLVIRALPADGRFRSARVVRTARADLQLGLLARRAWPGIAIASVVVVAGHTATFLIAARTAGSTASLTRMLPLALLVFLATAVPTNIGGWGPREGVAAWLFGISGLGTSQGIATATVYGVMGLAAYLPGAAVLLASYLPRRSRQHAAALEPRVDAPGAAVRWPVRRVAALEGGLGG